VETYQIHRDYVTFLLLILVDQIERFIERETSHLSKFYQFFMFMQVKLLVHA
jgi:hypothetical protein